MYSLKLRIKSNITRSEEEVRRVGHESRSRE